jgi:hypothetical protein
LGNTATTNGWFYVSGVFLGIHDCIFGECNFPNGLITQRIGTCSVWVLHSTFDNNDIEITVPPAAVSLLVVNPKIVDKLNITASASVPVKCFALYMSETNAFSETELMSKTLQQFSSTAVLSKSESISE